MPVKVAPLPPEAYTNAAGTANIHNGGAVVGAQNVVGGKKEVTYVREVDEVNENAINDRIENYIPLRYVDVLQRIVEVGSLGNG